MAYQLRIGAGETKADDGGDEQRLQNESHHRDLARERKINVVKSARLFCLFNVPR